MSVDKLIEKLVLYKHYKFSFGHVSTFQDGIFLGAIRKKNGITYKMLTRTNKGDYREGETAPRIYNFKDYKFKDGNLFIKYGRLLGRLSASESMYCNQVLEKRKL